MVYNKKEENIIEDSQKRLLTPKYDVVFQALFGREGSEGILAGLLSNILEKPIKNISLKENQILQREYPEEKLGILDLIANIDNKETVNIEIQLEDQYNMEKRLLYYWSRLYGKKLKSGEDYKNINKTISIVFLNFEMEKLKEYKDSHTVWKISELRNTKVKIFEDLEMHIVEMPKIKRYNETDEKLRRWIEFILNPESEEVRMSIKEDKILNEAYEKLEEISSDEHLRRIEELKMKKILDDRSVRNYLTEEGRNLEKLEIAKKLLNKGLTTEEIIEITGLTEEQIKTI